MKGLIEIKRIRVENANAVSGLTWGFPGVSPFLGFVHWLDRSLNTKLGSSDSPFGSVFGGCAIVCHEYQVMSEADDYGKHSLALTRNPLTKEGATAPFNEEGRMHLTVTLLIECLVDYRDFRDEYNDGSEIVEDKDWFTHKVAKAMQHARLAGGSVNHYESIRYTSLNLNTDKGKFLSKKILYSCLPGFALIDRSELVSQSVEQLAENNSDNDLIDAWMDFCSIRYRAEHKDESSDSKWGIVPPPDSGWFVPLVLGYQCIAEIEDAGKVDSARDEKTPFAPVEAVYGVGQWLSPHRASSVEDLIWRYNYQSPQLYLLENQNSLNVKLKLGE